MNVLYSVVNSIAFTVSRDHFLFFLYLFFLILVASFHRQQFAIPTKMLSDLLFSQHGQHGVVRNFPLKCRS